MFNIDSIDEYQLEITTYCNAACPQCPRNILGGGVNPHMPLSQSRDSWTGNGINTKDIAKFIEMCLNVQVNTVFEEVVMYINLHHDNKNQKDDT